jgi:AcrR family transcriptional regulator
MRLFWRHGYEGVSVGDLTKAIGVAPPSLYAAFGSKAGLYQEALNHYEGTLGCLDVTAIRSAASLAEAVRRLLEAAVKAVTDPERELGCMTSGSMIACHPEHAALARDAAARREVMREKIAQALQRFAGTDEVRGLSRHLAALMQGISIQARDGATPTELREIVESAVSGVAARFPKRRRKV